MTDGPGGRVAMISGANRGIGRAIAERLAAEDWRLSLGVRDPAAVADTLPPGALVQRFDAASGDGEAPWVEATLARFGRIDAVVNNAGIIIRKSVLEADDDDVEAMLQVNVKSPLRLVRAAYPALAATGRGRVVTIVSLSGKRVKSPGSSTYSVSKFAALGLAHAIRHSGWEDGVRSTAICPGYVATDMATGLTDRDPDAMTQPADIARVVAMVLDLPNTASVSEIPVNCILDDSY